MMHRTYIYNKVLALVLMVALAVCVACSKSEEESELTSRKAIGFRVYSNITRAAQTDVTTDNLVSFYVTALGNNEAYFNDLTFTKQTEGTFQNFWTSTPTYYWPSYNLTFCAYNTPGADYTFTPSITSTGQTIYTQIPTSLDKHEDLVAAYSASATASADGSASLTFNHYMTQVTVQARCMNKNYVVCVKGVKLANMANSGTYTFSDNTMTATAAEVNTATSSNFNENYESAAITLNSATEAVAAPDYKNVMQGSTATTTGRWYLIPQTVTSWDQASDKENTSNGTYLALWVKITTKSGTKIYPADKTWTETNEWAWTAIPIPADLKFEQGKKYTVSVNFFSATGKGAGYQDPEEEGPDKPGKGGSSVGSTNLILFGTQVNEWASGSETEITVDL